MVGFFAAVDAIAARFTRLIGIGASFALLSRYKSDSWSNLLQKIGVDCPQADDIVQKLILIVVAVFALLQGAAVAVLVGESMGWTFIGKRNALFFTVVPVVAIITSFVIVAVNQVATEVLKR